MSEEGSGKGGSMKKMILLVAIGLVVAGGGGFAYLKFFASKAHAAPKGEAAGHEAKDGKAAKNEAEAEAETDAEDTHGAPPAVMVYRNIVNLDRKNAYLKVELHLLFRDPELGKAATSDKPTPENSLIRAMLLDLLSGRSLEEASDPEFRKTFCQEVKEKLNERFAAKGAHKDGKGAKPPLKDVLVVDWAISA